MIARTVLATTLLCFTAVTALPLVKPSDTVCQSLNTSCQDLWLASSCKNVKPCIAEVWEKLEVPLDNSNVCNICKEMVKEARDQLLSNETQEELRQVLEGSCNLIPISFVAEMCRKAVDDFIPDLIDILVSSLNPDQVCSIAGLCNPDYMTRQSLTQKLQQALVLSNFQSRVFLPSPSPSSAPSPKKGSTCNECKTAMKYSKKLFSRLSETELSAVVLKVCQERLGTNSSECTAFANVFLPPLFKYLQGMSTDQFCGYLKHCKALGTQEHKVKPFTARDDLTCDFCKQLVEHLREIMSSNTTQEELKQAFLNFCEELGPAAEECQNLLEQYFDMVYSYLLEALDPDGMCSTLGLCPSMAQKMNRVFVKLFPALQQQKLHLLKLKYHKKSGSYRKSSVYIPLVKVFPSLPNKYLYGNKSDMTVPMVSLISPLNVTSLDTSASQSSSALHDPDCEMCQAIVGYVYNELKEKKTKDDIENVLKYVCNIFYGDEKQRCLTMVDTYINILVDMILQQLTPREICATLKFCPPPKSPLLVHLSFGKGVAVKNPTDTECDICQSVLQFVFNELKDSRTETEIKQALDQVCSQFPTTTQQQCVNLINTYFDVLVQLILQDFTPAEICQKMSLCPSSIFSSSTPLNKDKEVPFRQVANTECEICQTVVQFVYNQLKDHKTEDEIKQALDQVCSLLPTTAQQQCVNMVNTYFDILVQLILQDFTPSQICQTLSLCPSSKFSSSTPLNKDKEVPFRKVANTECEICQTVVQFVYDQLKDSKTEDEIKQALDQVCSLLPTTAQQQCVNMINTYFDTLVQLILQDFTPIQICQTLSLCPSSKVSSSTPLNKGKEVPLRKVANTECDICQTVVQYVYDQLKDNKTEDEIKQALDQACSLLPKEDQQTCVDFINRYFDLLMSLILQEMTPSQICEALGLCSSLNAAVTASPPPASQVPPKDASEMECDFCQNVVQFVYNELKDDKTEEAIKQALSQVCSLFPEADRQKCSNMVNTYFDLLVGLLIQDATPLQICQTLGFCASSSHGNLECTFCNYALHFIQNQLVDNVTEARVEQILDKLCDSLPREVADECKAFVEEYGPAMMVLLAQEIDPSIVCVAIKACPKEGLEKHSKASLVNHKLSECETCTMVVDYLERVLHNSKNDQEISKAIAGVCDIVPRSIRSECKALIQAYGPYLLSALGDLGDSHRVCKNIDLCSKAAPPPRLLGSDYCTFGPSYWCKSTKHAASCNAHEYCKKKVWKQ